VTYVDGGKFVTNAAMMIAYHGKSSTIDTRSASLPSGKPRSTARWSWRVLSLYSPTYLVRGLSQLVQFRCQLIR
jgi:hypothetical protein